MSQRRVINSVAAARYGWLPWPMRMRAGELEMRRRSKSSLDVRAALLPYVRAIDIRNQRVASDRGDMGPIWFYWAQGLDHAPMVARVCLERLRRFAGSREVVVLDDLSLSSFIDFPRHIVAKRSAMGPTHFSDVLRSALLAAHGGTWVDATVYLTDRIPIEITDLPFFAFSRGSDPNVLSSWFIHARAGHPSMLAQRDMLFAYWQEQDTLVDYFLFHFLFECGVTLDRRLRAAWERVPEVDFALSQRLQDRLLEPFDPQWFDAACEETSIHKLTWKLDTSNAIDPPTFYDRLIRDAR